MVLFVVSTRKIPDSVWKIYFLVAYLRASYGQRRLNPLLKDVGQMNFYLNYIETNEMLKEENSPVGIILCTESKRSRVFVEYALGGLSNKVFVSKYKLYLPTKRELEEEVKKEMRIKKRGGDDSNSS